MDADIGPVEPFARRVVGGEEQSPQEVGENGAADSGGPGSGAAWWLPRRVRPAIPRRGPRTGPPERSRRASGSGRRRTVPKGPAWETRCVGVPRAPPRGARPRARPASGARTPSSQQESGGRREDGAPACPAGPSARWALPAASVSTRGGWLFAVRRDTATVTSRETGVAMSAFGNSTASETSPAPTSPKPDRQSGDDAAHAARTVRALPVHPQGERAEEADHHHRPGFDHERIDALEPERHREREAAEDHHPDPDGDQNLLRLQVGREVPDDVLPEDARRGEQAAGPPNS